MEKLILVLSAGILVSNLVCGIDIKTLDGTEYKDVTVSQVNPAGLVVENNSGVFQLDFRNLPEDLQKKYNYSPAKAAEYVRNIQSSISARNLQLQKEKQMQMKKQQELNSQVQADLQNYAQQQAAANTPQENQPQQNYDSSDDAQNNTGVVLTEDDPWATPFAYNRWYNNNYHPYVYNHDFRNRNLEYGGRTAFGSAGHCGRIGGSASFGGGGGFHGGGGGRR